MRDQLIKQRQSCSMLLNIYQLGFLQEPQQRFQSVLAVKWETESVCGLCDCFSTQGIACL